MENTGGIAGMVKAILQVANKGSRKIFYATDPIKAVNEIIQRVNKEKQGEKKFHLEYKNIG